MKRILAIVMILGMLTGCASQKQTKAGDDPVEHVKADEVITGNDTACYTTEPTQEELEACPEKPVIYLYPEEETRVHVELNFNGELTSVYPAYENGWNVVAAPDGTLTDPETGREYYCLFWEGISNVPYDFSEGFVVEGANTEAFLEETLKTLGLTDQEANEFIIYWLPRMEGNAYNLISFQQETYTDNAVLKVEPAPDTVLRVFMAYQPLEYPIRVLPQKLETTERTGFTLVEWGGAEIQ